MTDAPDDSSGEAFSATVTGFGGIAGSLPDITGMNVTISGSASNPAEFFTAAIARHHAAVDAYVAALGTAGLDVTDDRVVSASTDLHSSLTTLAIAHTALAGSGFPSPRLGSEARAATPKPPEPKSMPRVSPALHTAITGNLSQRASVVDLEPIPLEAQLVLAKDPDEDVRGWLLTANQLDRATIMLMERDEDDPDIRARLGEHPFSSIEAKRAAPIYNLRYDVIEMACEQLALSKHDFDRIWAARIEIEERSFEGSNDALLLTTFGEVLDRLGLG